VDMALRQAAPIRVNFTGVTASLDAVLIQGFVENEALDEVRDALRRELRIHGVARGIDTRYRLQTAHMTAVRFRAPFHDSKKFATMLELARNLPFGTTT